MSGTSLLPVGLGPLLLITAVLCFAAPAHAFGAGNIPDNSVLDGHLWRHGDIADLLITLPMSFITNRAFKKMDVKVIYFGNWLRDYSQLLDVGSITKVPEDILRSLVSILGFMEHGYATGEFDVTAERLGVYRPEEHIDNPKGYASDAQSVQRNLRGPVRDIELAIDPETCMKNYIASEGKGFDTSSVYIRNQLRECIRLGRAARQNGDADTRNNSLIHLGGALHTLEDFAAHSNYVELALQKCGEKGIFAYVGDGARYTTKTESAVAPIVTGTFGPLDLLQSILGEIDDKTAARNLNELDERLSIDSAITENALWLLQVALSAGSALQIFSGDLAETAKNLMGNANEPSKPAADWDALNKAPNSLWQAIEPIFEFRDSIAKTVSENINVPFIQPTIAKISQAVDMFVYSLLSAYVKPIIENIRQELQSVTNEVSKQDANAGNIFAAGDDTNPSHSQLAKDHFTNVLNNPAGLVATVITNLTTQSVVQAWDNNNVDADAIINEILKALHHPFNADPFCRVQMQMLATVKVWWDAKPDNDKAKLRRQLSKEGVQNKENQIIVDPSFWASQAKGPAKFEGSAPNLAAEPAKTGGDVVVAVITDILQSGLGIVAGGPLDIPGISPGMTNPLDNLIAQVGSDFTKVIEDVGLTIPQIASAPGIGSILKDALVDEIAASAKTAVQTVNDIGRLADAAVDEVASWFRW